MYCFYEKRLQDLSLFTSWGKKTGREHAAVEQGNEKQQEKGLSGNTTKPVKGSYL